MLRIRMAVLIYSDPALEATRARVNISFVKNNQSVLTLSVHRQYPNCALFSFSSLHECRDAGYSKLRVTRL